MIEAVKLQDIICFYTKLYQINRASVLKHITLTSQNCIDNMRNGFVHGKYIILTGLSLSMQSDQVGSSVPRKPS